jgi:hypothetical protein
MTATPNFASDALVGADAGGSAAPAASAGPFVLNLCSSTTPMALAQTELPELKRFTFFVSRRFEEGRERFRLHMGYFATLAEAEEWLGVVREIYPGAWAGEAPGRKLRERAAAAAAAQAQHAAGPQPQAPSAPRTVAPAPPRAASPAAPAPLPLNVPVVHAAPVVAPRAAVPAAATPVLRPAAPKPAPPAPRPAPAARVAHAQAHRAPSVTPQRPAPAPPVTRPAPAARAAGPVQRPAASAVPRPATPAGAQKPVFEDSNVREVLKALGDSSATGETRQMRTPAAPRPVGQDSSSLSDTQVLKLLETRRSESSEAPVAAVDDDVIPLLKPDDTGTRRALKVAVTNNAPVSFAVQLQWSVQPVELEKLPPLAIFSAYTLYTVEGSRDARKWYGVRLGFFSDAISAKQVAHYVRSEFNSVAVVPVSPQEKSRATEQDRAAALINPVPTRSDPTEEFKLFDEPPAAAAVPAPAAKPAAQAPSKPAVRAPQPPGDASQSRGRARGKVGARERRSAPTLEETLEILGASQLSVDEGSRETINDSGVRHLRVEVQKNSPFSRLLERLSERMKKS